MRAMKSLGDMLVERGAVSAEDLAKAQQIQQSAGGNLGALLVGIGAVSEDVLLQTQSEQLGVVYLRDTDDLPDNLTVYRFMVDSPVKLDWLLDNHVLLWREDDTLKCIGHDVQDRALLEALSYFYPTEPVTFYLAANHQIDRLLESVRKERAMETLFSGDDARQLRELAEEAPIIALVSNLLAQAVDLDASDIHVEPAEEQFAVRLRVDGVLHTRLTQPIERFPGGGVAHQADRRHRHRRASPAPGRAHQRAYLRQGDGHPRVHGAVRVRRVHRVASARPGTQRIDAPQPRHGA